MSDPTQLRDVIRAQRYAQTQTGRTPVNVRGGPPGLGLNFNPNGLPTVDFPFGSDPHVELNPLSHAFDVSNIGWRVNINVFYSPGAGCVREPTVPEDWEIGFVQILYRDHLEAHYDTPGHPPVVVAYGSGANEPPLVDADREANETRPWVTGQAISRPGLPTIVSWVVASYGGGRLRPDNIALLYDDDPRFSFHAHNTNSNARLLRLTKRSQFQIFLAARRTNDPATDVASYHVLAQTPRFNSIVSVSMNWSSSRPTATATIRRSNMIFRQTCTGRIPRVSGPTANEVLGTRSTNGIGPRFRWIPEQTLDQVTEGRLRPR